MKSKFKKILILMGGYLPGHKDGGPSRTIVNLTDMLGEEYAFYIACYDRDHGDESAYSNFVYDVWNSVGKEKVWYVEPGGFSETLILQLAQGMDIIYLSSFYEVYGYRSLWLKKKKKIHCPVVLASMGVFSKAALKHKFLKKKIFIFICKLVGLFENITWSVTSELEADDVKKTLGKTISYVVAEDLPRNIEPQYIERHNKCCKIVFLSRICAHKNLDFAIRALQDLKENICFTIYGPIQEPEYWSNCQELLKSTDVTWSYGGDVMPEKVLSCLAEQDVLIFPSKSENYGHVVFEAMSVGCIPVVSEHTPWQCVMEHQAGYVLPLNEKLFTEKIIEIVNMSDEKRKGMAMRAVDLAKKKLEQAKQETGYRKLFDM